MLKMTPDEYEYWEGFIATFPVAQTRFIGVKFDKNGKPDFVPNFNTLFSQYITETHPAEEPHWMDGVAYEAYTFVEQYMLNLDDLYDNI
jgi:hypothetical protein